MLTILTASPGGGKSQWLIDEVILGHLDEAKKKGTAPRPIFTNIKGLRTDLILARYPELRGIVIEPAPDDWRNTPDGSIVIYDEAQQIFPATGKPGLPDDERIARFDTHRHTGHDLYFATQHPTLLHHWLRKFVNRHVHLERPNNAEQSTVYEWGKCKGDPDDYHARQGADKSSRNMRPATWELYDSATVHTHKFVMPKGAKWAIRIFAGLLLMVPLAFCAPKWFAGSATAKPEADASSGSVFHPTIQGGQGATLSENSQFAWRPAAVQVEPINGCMAGRMCRCWDFEGKVLDLDDGTCRNLAEGRIPMPIDLNRFMDKSGDERRGGGERIGAAAPPPSLPNGSRASTHAIRPEYQPPAFERVTGRPTSF